VTRQEEARVGTITDLEERRRRRLPAQLKRATIRSTPADPTDKVMVSIDAQPGYLRGPCPWPQGGPVPQTGDAAWVMESDEPDLVVVLVWSTDPQFAP
jgi:hypothetical protein